VAVDPSRQHQGIGRALLAVAETHALSLATRILLYTNTAMSEVVAVADQHDDSDDGVILATNACRWRILAA
jgi:GNAT superfamily N-acetyltransferase